MVAFLDAFVHVGEVGAESGDGVENGSTLASVSTTHVYSSVKQGSPTGMAHPEL